MSHFYNDKTLIRGQTYVPDGEDEVEAKKVLLWDRKAESGFPGTCPMTCT
jgi:predicted Rdx family selenoprotein